MNNASVYTIVSLIGVVIMLAIAPVTVGKQSGNNNSPVQLLIVTAQDYNDGLYGDWTYGGESVDVTAPILSSASNAATGETTSSATVSTDEANGTLYWVVTTTASTPSQAQVIAGQNAAGVVATAAGSQSVSGTGVQTISASGLNSGTQYYTHFVQVDISGNQSAVVSAGSFDTDTTTTNSGSSSSNSGSRTSSSETVVTNPISVETPSAPVVTSLPATDVFKRNISFVQPEINVSTDILNLQTFLNEFEGESLTITGIYDSASNEAVKRFQRKYAREILDVWNLQEATGYVGITTRLKLNFLLKGQTAQCPVFTEYNGGKDGIYVSDEVMKTKEILADLDIYQGPIDRIWSPETNDALVVFQETFREVMLDPWNITEGTGYKYKTTNKFLNYFAGCDTGAIELEGVGSYQGI